ncbi:MAG: Ppx/GppA phosphatase family protein [Pseudomonadota bacterium]|nr:Ppx/GppA phosphatase family protein [Pseudomonadota bacterium]
MAVIDVGSNSVRLVIFGDSLRAPLTMLNERAFCALGQGMARTGQLNPDGIEAAIATLKRFRWIAGATGVARTIAFATAAVRDAADGQAFVKRVKRECDIRLTVLTGEEESRYAGMGVLFGTPDATGVVGDLGGSSLELAPIGNGEVGPGTTLSLGPLQFMDGDSQPERIRAATLEALDRINWLPGATGQTLHVVGGTWRAVAKLDMSARQYPLNVIQGYEMSADRAIALTRLIARQHPESLSGAEGIADRRLQVLPTASVVLETLVERLAPDRLHFSAHGVREGAYLDTLKPKQRRRDPLVAAAEAMALHEARFGVEVGQEVFDWIAPLFPADDARSARLRMVACILSDVGWRAHPDYRATQSFRRVLRAPLIGIGHPERVLLATAVMRRYSHKAGDEVLDEVRALVSPDDLKLAERIGAAIRLAHTLGGGAPGALAGIGLAMTDTALVLDVPLALQPVLGDAVETRLFRVARAFGVAHQIRVH